MPRGPPARTAKIVGHEAWTQPEETTTLSPNHPVNRPVCKRTGLESDTRDGVETSDCGFVPCCGRFGVLHLFQSLENAASIESPTCLLFTWRTLFFFFSVAFLCRLLCDGPAHVRSPFRGDLFNAFSCALWVWHWDVWLVALLQRNSLGETLRTVLW